jgi:hypothetical protein
MREERGACRARGGGGTARRRKSRCERGPPVLGAGGWHWGDEGGGGDMPGPGQDGVMGPAARGEGALDSV